MASQVSFPKKEEEAPAPQPLTPSFEAIETPKEKLIRKLKQEPLVPLGSLLTCGALIVASHYLRKGNKDSFNRALRWRIYFQGITVVAALGGMYYYGAGQAATPPPVLPRTSAFPSSSPDQDSVTSSSAYSSIATTPGRPPTNHQVAKAEDREAKSRQEWQERFQNAQKASDEEAERKALEAALLKGTGMSLDDRSRESVGAGALARERAAETVNSSSDASTEASPAPRVRPVIGQDRRDR